MAASQRVRFTTQRLEKLICPAGLDRVYIHDTDVKGLCVSVLASGSKVFFVYRRVEGRPTRTRLGEWPGLSVDAARKLANKTLGKIAAGQNPHAERLTARKETTFGELFAIHLEHAKIHNKTWTDNRRQYRLHVEKRLGNRRLSEITRADIEAMHAHAGKTSPVQANRTLSLVAHIFNKTAPKCGYNGPNPARGVEKFKEHSRDRFLSPEELGRFFLALESEKELFRDLFALLLWTGARRGNVAAMQWEDVDLGQGTWRIPSTKNGKPAIIPLTAPAVEILTRRKASASSAFVFPSYGKSGYIAEPKAAWERVLATAGITGLRMHDLRRTAGSYMAATGASLPIIGKALGHLSTSSTHVYARLNVDPVRAAMDASTAAMMAAAKGAKKKEQ